MDLDGLEVDRSCTTNSSSSTCENVTRRLEDSYDSAMCCYQSSHLRCGETVTRRGETARGCGEAKPTAMHKVARRGTRGRSSGMERVLSHLVAVAVLIAILDWHSVSAQGLFDLPTTFVGPAEIVKKPQNVTVKMRDSFTISCTVKAGPFSHSGLFHNNTRIKFVYKVDHESRVTTWNEQEMIYRVDSAKMSDSGEYECRASTETGEHEVRAFSYVTVDGEGKPLVRTDTDQIITAGAHVQLNCAAEGLPVPSTQWVVPKAISAVSKVLINNKRGTLMIANAQIHNNGFYTCRATNIHGTVEKRVKLTVVEVAYPPPGLGSSVAGGEVKPTTKTCEDCKPVVKSAVKGIQDRDLIIIIACSGAVIVIACVVTLVVFIMITGYPPSNRKPRASRSSPSNTESTTGTMSTRSVQSSQSAQSPSQTLRYDAENQPVFL